jgi:hypothetical protein
MAPLAQTQIERRRRLTLATGWALGSTPFFDEILGLSVAFALKACGIPHRKFYCTRHTFITEHVKRNAFRSRPSPIFAVRRSR